MSSQDKLEQVLRQIHLFIAEGRSAGESGEEIIINKRVMLEHMNRLSVAIYEIMDEYEMTRQGRERAEREMQKRSKDIVNRADLQAEDVYAASILYANEALQRVQNIMQEAMDSFDAASRRVKDRLEQEKSQVRSNQSELQGNLIDLKDTAKYLQVLEDVNRRLERNQDAEKRSERESSYANIKPEIRINPEYFERIGVPLDTLEMGGVPGNSALVHYSTAQEEFMYEVPQEKEEPTREAPEIRVNQNAAFFRRRAKKKKGDEG